MFRAAETMWFQDILTSLCRLKVMSDLYGNRENAVSRPSDQLSTPSLLQ